MRFAFKRSPQDTTWDAMLDVWRAADDVEVFEPTGAAGERAAGIVLSRALPAGRGAT